MLESVRMFMGRGFNIPHRAYKDTTIQGYNIPKDTMVIANLNAILMDENLFDEPLKFKPERFLDEKGTLSVPEAYLPFGFGKLATWFLFKNRYLGISAYPHFGAKFQKLIFCKLLHKKYFFFFKLLFIVFIF